MHKTIYVDLDEEITNIMDKVRRESEEEIFLVIPKGAMILQGVINLKLLKKETEKLGKKLVVATNDMHARKVIDQVGIKTSDVDEAQMTGSAPGSISEISREEEVSNRAVEEATEQLSEIKRGGEVGSQSFFESASGDSSTMPGRESVSSVQPGNLNGIEMPKERKKFSQQEFQLKAKNDLLTAPGISSNTRNMGERFEATTQNQEGPIATTEDVSPIQKSEGVNGSPQFDIGPQKQQQISEQKNSVPEVQPKLPNNFFGDVPKGMNLREVEIGSDQVRGYENEASRKAEEYFLPTDADEVNSENKKKNKKKRSRPGERGGKRWGFVLVLIVLFLVISAFGAWGYINYPKVTMDIYLENKEVSKEIKITVKEEGYDSEENGIKGEYLEITVEEEMEFDATGETYESDDGKAKGKVRIINKYSEKNQPLVATTRVLSEEGKLFRLSKSVTVPGMEGEDPGEVEVSVIADEPGEDFNLSPTKFTIEGFKGGDKYEKFEVVSDKSMEGGGEVDGNKKLTMVSADDIKNARTKTIDELEKKLEEKIGEKIGGEKKVFVDSVEKEIIEDSEKISHEEKEITKTFTYSIQQKVKLISFLEEDVRKIAVAELEKELGDGYEVDGLSAVVYKKGIVDLENKSLTMYVDAKMSSWPIVNADELKESISGKKGDEVKTVLLDYPDIKRIELTFKPSWMSSIPPSKDKITINEKKEEVQ